MFESMWSVLLVAIGGLIAHYPVKWVDKQKRELIYDIVRKDKVYYFLRKFFNEQKTMVVIEKIVLPLFMLGGFIIMGFGVYIMFN